MKEHDSLVSHALNNMTVNELANAYADLKLKLRKICKHEWSEGIKVCEICGAWKK